MTFQYESCSFISPAEETPNHTLKLNVSQKHTRYSTVFCFEMGGTFAIIINRPSVRLCVSVSSLKQKGKEQRRVIICPRCLSVCRLIAQMRSIGF